jgi:DNA helicase-2/ATP-dependent DNA helicase PcrA
VLALLDDLTDAQRDAVQHIDGPLLMLAGPGSGKTRVVTRRIAWMLAQGIAGQRILALTFTNKAADEMRARVEAVSPGHGVWLSTFHRFCARLLRKYAPLVGLHENFTIYDTDASGRLLRAAVAAADRISAPFTLDAIGNEISRAKSRLIDAESYTPDPTSDLQRAVAAIYPHYTRRLLASNAADFDDLLLHVATLLRDNAEVRQSLDERYSYVMIDEYQDTNFAQYAIARALSIDYPNLAVTGDPDQSIYGWRGASIRNILDFEKDFPGVRVIRLEQNYRSTKSILRVAAELIRHNVRRKEKGLFTENGAGAPVRLVMYATEREEAEDIAHRIAADLRAGACRAGDVAIFYRVNALSRAVELALREAGVPYQMINGLAFFQREEIRDMIAYLQLLDNPQDQIAFLRVINTPTRGIGKTTVGRLADYAMQRGISFLDAAVEAKRIDRMPKRAAAALAAFAAMFERLRAASHGPIEETLGLVLSESGYQQQLKDSGDEVDQQRLANIEELLTVARQFDERHGGRGPLDAFLEETCLVNDTDDWEQSVDRVTLMTLHASKGLEFPVVYLIACEENILPHERSRQNEAELEEERRLMFVGITRAKRQLQLSLARCRDFRGQRRFAIPSHFLMQLPRDEMELHMPGMTGMPATTMPHDEGDPCIDIEPPDVEPVFSRSEPVERAPLSFARLTTAAELINGGPGEPLSPEAFSQGMRVRHPEFGLGKIAAISGLADERTATVDFASSAGRQKIVLAHSPLRPLK